MKNRNRRRLSDWLLYSTAALVLALILSFGIWVRASAPCSWWSWAPVKDVPARCLMHR